MTLRPDCLPGNGHPQSRLLRNAAVNLEYTLAVDFLALGYDTARAAFAALGEASDPEALRRRLHEVRLADGVTGPVQMGGDGNPQAKTIVLERLTSPDGERFVKRLGG